MKRHRVDVLSLVFGILFVVAALAGATDNLDIPFFRFEWLAAAGLLVVGAILLMSVGRTTNRNGS